MKNLHIFSTPKKSLSKAGLLLAIASLAFAPLALSPTNPAFADAATISDSTNVCQVAVSSSTVTINATSATVSLQGDDCVVTFLAAGSYSVTIPDGVNALDYLVVGGGGGGGSGGGGGGGVLQAKDYAVSDGTTYAVSVGAGGAGGSGGGSASPVNATAGEPSIFGSITALGGGSGGQMGQPAGAGASGGGAHYDCIDVTCAGVGTPDQGNNGAVSSFPGYGGGGGGGGAGQAAEPHPLHHIGGKGGDGLNSSITGTLTFFGGGGGGGVNSNDGLYCGLNEPGTAETDYYCSNEPLTTGGGDGGAGGGGKGSSYGFTGGTQGEMANGSAGLPNTGGGGGGTDPEDSYAYAGGSGLVVLRFAPSNAEQPVFFESEQESEQMQRQLAATGANAWQLPAAALSMIALGFVFLRASRRQKR
jgi:hypothetical protein